MAIFIIGLILAVAVATAYVSLGALDFLRIRRELSRVTAEHPATPLTEPDGDVDPARETVGFAWRALGGVVASVALLYAISHLWWAWYAFPLLAIGTGVAVSVAFVIDPTKSA